MFKFLVVLLLIIIASKVSSAPVSTWSGATANACYSRCSQDWAETKLTQEELSELNRLRQTQPSPQLIEIRDGDVFRLATYYKNDQPIAYRTTTVAVLDQPTTAQGWHLDDWSWVKLDDCSNWTIVQHEGLYPQQTPLRQRVVSDVFPYSPLFPFYREFYPTPVTVYEKPTPQVPLSSSVWFMIGAILTLVTMSIYKTLKD